MWGVSAGLLQAATDLSSQVEWIMRAQVVMAVGAILLVVLAIVAGISAFVLIRALTRLVRALEEQVSELGPRTEPIFERAQKVTDDAAHISDSVRSEISRVHERMDELDQRFRGAVEDVEARVQRFGAVMRVVQDEFEDILLDTAATARGVHATAEALGKPVPDPRPPFGGRMPETPKRSGGPEAPEPRTGEGGPDGA